MRSILTCINCGTPVQSLGRTGTIFSTTCPSCGLSSYPMVANYLNSIRSRDIEVIRYSSEKRRALPSQYP